MRHSINPDVVQAWLTAAKDLGIEVTAPFSFTTHSGATETFEALIHDFGGPRGTLTGLISKDSTQSRQESGYYASNLSDSYRHYDRALFIATLDDWKWFGIEEKRPSWYTGRNWS